MNRQIFGKKNNRKGFSLVETVVTLAIFGILLAMLSQVLLLNLQISRKVQARTRFREELSELTGLIQRDVRNADVIYGGNPSECGNDLNFDGLPFEFTEENGCKFRVANSVDYIWVNAEHAFCPNLNGAKSRICKINSITNEVQYKTSDIITIESFEVEIDAVDNEQATILITIKASATNPSWDINNQIRQIVVTTRNFN